MGGDSGWDVIAGAAALFTAALAALGSLGAGWLAARSRRVMAERRETSGVAIEEDIERLAALAAALGEPPHRVVQRNADISVGQRSDTAREIDVLKGRVAKIEERLPDDAVLDKVASLNEALLAKGLENVQKEIDRLQQSMLTRWDVVTVLFATLAAIAAVVGAVVGIVDLAG